MAAKIAHCGVPDFAGSKCSETSFGHVAILPVFSPEIWWKINLLSYKAMRYVTFVRPKTALFGYRTRPISVTDDFGPF